MHVHLLLIYTVLSIKLTTHNTDTHSPLITCTQHFILIHTVFSLHAHNTFFWYTQSSQYMHTTHYIDKQSSHYMNTTLYNDSHSPLITCTQHFIMIHTVLSLHAHNTLYWYTQYLHYMHLTHTQWILVITFSILSQ